MSYPTFGVYMFFRRGDADFEANDFGFVADYVGLSKLNDTYELVLMEDCPEGKKGDVVRVPMGKYRMEGPVSK